MAVNIAREIGKLTRQHGLQGMQSTMTQHGKYTVVEFADGTEFAVGQVPQSVASRSIELSRNWARLS